MNRSSIENLIKERIKAKESNTQKEIEENVEIEDKELIDSEPIDNIKMDLVDDKNAMARYVLDSEADKIRRNIINLIEQIMNFEVINEQRAKDLGSMKVSVFHERDSYESNSTYRVYMNVILYFDKSYTDRQISAIKIGFHRDFKHMLELNRNNIGSIHRIYIAGTEDIEVNERLEGYKILLALNEN